MGGAGRRGGGSVSTPRVWNMRDRKRPKDAVYVGRPSKWGNPFVIGRDGSREEVIALFEADLSPELRQAARAELRGKHLTCWCAPAACHADVLLRIANDGE